MGASVVNELRIDLRYTTYQTKQEIDFFTRKDVIWYGEPNHGRYENEYTWYYMLGAKDHPGRGVFYNVDYYYKDIVNMVLQLPTTSYDVDVFFDVLTDCISLGECSVKMNQEDMPLGDVERLRKEFQEYNRKLLEAEYQKVMDDPKHIWKFRAMLTYMFLDQAEFNRLPSDLDVNEKLALFLKQRETIMMREPFFSSHTCQTNPEELVYEFFLRFDEYFVIPKDLTIPFVNRELYEAKNYTYSFYEVKFVDDERKIIGRCSAKEFLDHCPRTKIRQYDALQYVVGKFTVEDACALIEEVKKSKAE